MKENVTSLRLDGNTVEKETADQMVQQRQSGLVDYTFGIQYSIIFVRILIRKKVRGVQVTALVTKKEE